MNLTLRTVAEWTGGNPDTVVTGVSWDSRTIRAGELFVALTGENHDAHAFVPNVAAKGATGAIVMQADALGTLPGVVVADTLRALGDLAHRFRWSPPLIPWVGVTGSNGKTTTREIIAALLATRGKTVRPPRNWNNLVGLPMTLLSTPDDAWAGVVELGTSAPGEIGRLTEIADPTVGIVTCIASAHLAGFGSEEAIAHEKASIFDRLPADGLGIYPAASPYAQILRDRIRSHAASFAVEAPADLTAERVRTAAVSSRAASRFSCPSSGGTTWGTACPRCSRSSASGFR
jgi:UDP-N-acetylmuramoyl-tripeptide--D-alanyl-D-alanine ligase